MFKLVYFPLSDLKYIRVVSVQNKLWWSSYETDSSLFTSRRFIAILTNPDYAYNICFIPSCFNEVCSPKTEAFWVVEPCRLVNIYQSTRRNTPEEFRLQNKLCENLKSLRLQSLYFAVQEIKTTLNFKET
jgi:hypothetical protein